VQLYTKQLILMNLFEIHFYYFIWFLLSFIFYRLSWSF